MTALRTRFDGEKIIVPEELRGHPPVDVVIQVESAPAAERVATDPDGRASKPEDRLAALRRLQNSLALTDEQANEWIAQVADERKASSVKRGF